MPREYGDGYYNDPADTGEKVIRMLAIHDNVKDPSAITLGSSFEELGLNELDLAEVTLQLEQTFDVYIPDEVCEGFTTVNDIVEWISRNVYVKSWQKIKKIAYLNF